MVFPRYYSSIHLSLSFWFLAAIVDLVKSDGGCPVMSTDEICVPESDQVTFHLYTRETANKSFEINFNNIEEAPFLPSAPLKVLIHGYTGWKDYSPNMELRPAYFKKDDFNILSIDWSRLAVEGCYIEATRNVKPVGQCVARMLEKIVEVRKDMKPEDVHVIGFSLGAHVAGFVGKSLAEFRATRVTGLDPALPLFDDIFNSGSSLSEQDADFVDVIHSNGGMKGKSIAVGHVDFYANGGSIQPGCAPTNTSCHHVRAVEIFAESIYSEIGFYGFKCESLIDYMRDCCSNSGTEPGGVGWVRLGEYVENTSRGSYYFDTSDKHPLALGQLHKERTVQTSVEHAMDTEEKDKERDSSDQAKARLIVKYNGADHDITRFGKFHPGGKRTLQRFAGRDVSETLERTNHSPAALKLVPEYRVENRQHATPTNADDLDRDLIDWSRPLLSQVGSLADNYQAWLLAPVDRNLRLFQSDLMESLTVVSPRTALFVWPPLLVLLTAVAYYQALWHQHTSLSATYLVLLGWCLGLLLWPLVEYSIHRWLFHACPPPSSPLLITLHFGMHGLHHKSPFDTRRLLFPPVPAITLAALTYLPLRVALAAPLATAVLAGALTGFLGYDLTHFYLHTGSPQPGSRLYRLKRRHNQHHFAQFDRGYGISSSFWDHIFKTGITLKDIKFELRW